MFGWGEFRGWEKWRENGIFGHLVRRENVRENCGPRCVLLNPPKCNLSKSRKKLKKKGEHYKSSRLIWTKMSHAMFISLLFFSLFFFFFFSLVFLISLCNVHFSFGFFWFILFPFFFFFLNMVFFPFCFGLFYLFFYYYNWITYSYTIFLIKI